MTQKAFDLTGEIGSIVGADHVRGAGAQEAIDGVTAGAVVEPGTPAEVAQVLRLADRAGISVVPRGGSTKLGWGNPPRHAGLVVSTARLNRVLEHAWADMTVTVEAGCRVADLQQTLAQHGQRLALDPLWPEQATIGGILATNDSGALRLRFGSLRDLVIGITLALADGTLARSGGKVVKNVAGYDLPKLATGSLGTLGVITEAVFRLHPLPRQSRVLSFEFSEPGALAALLLKVLDSQLVCSAIQLRAASSEKAHLEVGFEGTAEGIAAQIAGLAKMTRLEPRAEVGPQAWKETHAPGFWQVGSPAVVAKFSVLPAELSNLLEWLRSAEQSTHVRWQMVAQGVGIGWLRLESTAENLAAAVTEVRRQLVALQGNLVVLACPAQMKSAIDVWGPPGDSLELMRRIKKQLDPGGILNPGRFVGGI
ncbi:MAG TPA: FAD-binding oxidoreductase [Terriglobales bacterium]|nr:FAD-binding oxidoreductase [Terriglobales bacterium]